MTTQVIFNIDKKLKMRAMKKAQSRGLPFGAILKLATKAFVDGSFDVGLIPNEEFNPSARKNINRALKDRMEGKNLSARFGSAKEAIDYFKN